MPDKLTDAEIVKALEDFINHNGHCVDCPFIMKNALDLINHQQAKNKNLQERNVILKGLVDTQKAENERLKKENKILSKNADTAFQDGLNEAQDLYAEQVKNEIKAEAYKEFHIRLKARFKANRDIAVAMGSIYEAAEYKSAEELLDNLLKELVGE